jgi:hypothetical protein
MSTHKHQNLLLPNLSTPTSPDHIRTHVIPPTAPLLPEHKKMSRPLEKKKGKFAWRWPRNNAIALVFFFGICPPERDREILTSSSY